MRTRGEGPEVNFCNAPGGRGAKSSVLLAAGALSLILAASVLSAETLPVRKDGLRPGRFFVGVVAGGDQETPIVVEVRQGSELSPARKYRSPEKRAFDLCAMLRAAGMTGQAGDLYLTVTRGPGSTRFKISYDGKACPATAPTPPPAPSGGGVELPGLARLMALDTASSGAAKPPVEITEPSPVPAVKTPSLVAQVESPSPAPSPTETPVAPAVAAASLPVPPPAVTPPPVVTAAAAATPPPPPPVAAPADGSVSFDLREASGASLSAADRRLTENNLESFAVFLDENESLKTEDYRFVLTFRQPVNVDGIDRVVLLQARAVAGKPRDFFDEGIEQDIDVPGNPRETKILSFSFSKSMAIELPRINHLVYVKVRMGDLNDAVFWTRTGVKRYRPR